MYITEDKLLALAGLTESKMRDAKEGSLSQGQMTLVAAWYLGRKFEILDSRLHDLNQTLIHPPDFEGVVDAINALTRAWREQ